MLSLHLRTALILLVIITFPVFNPVIHHVFINLLYVLLYPPLSMVGIYEPTDTQCGGWPVYRKLLPDELQAIAAAVAKFQSTSDDGSSQYNTASTEMIPAASSSSSSSIPVTTATAPSSTSTTSAAVIEEEENDNPVQSDRAQSNTPVKSEDEENDSTPVIYWKTPPAEKTTDTAAAVAATGVGVDAITSSTSTDQGLTRESGKSEGGDGSGSGGGSSSSSSTSLIKSTDITTSNNNNNNNNDNIVTDPPSVASSPSSSTVWLEYNAYFRSWQIKPTACRGTNRSWAYCNTTSLCGTPPQLIKGTWEVLEDEDFRAQVATHPFDTTHPYDTTPPTQHYTPFQYSILTISFTCLPPSPPVLLPLSLLSTPLFVQESICLMTLGDWLLDDLALKALWTSAIPIDMRGATGNYGPIVNGIFDPLETFDAGYRKRNDPSVLLEYNRTRKLWQVSRYPYTRSTPSLPVIFDNPTHFPNTFPDTYLVDTTTDDDTNS